MMHLLKSHRFRRRPPDATSNLAFVLLYILTLPWLIRAAVEQGQTATSQTTPERDRLKSTENHELLNDPDETPSKIVLVEQDGTVVARDTTSAPTALSNNTPGHSNIDPGQTLYYSFGDENEARDRVAGEDHGREKRDGDSTMGRDVVERDPDAQRGQGSKQNTQPERTVYVSINTCLQPTFKDSALQERPPQLEIYVSSSRDNQNPGPDSPRDTTRGQTLMEGLAVIEVPTSNTVYIGVHAPDVDVKDGTWNFDIAASVDMPYHSSLPGGPYLYMIDSDTDSALLVTRELQDAKPDSVEFPDWVKEGPPLSLFVSNVNDTLVRGLGYSFCGLYTNARIKGAKYGTNSGIELGLTRNQPGHELEQQFFVPDLNATSTYYGFAARIGNEKDSVVPGGGGTVLTAMNFTTKRDANCGLIFNLTFCDTVAYAVPANPNNYPDLADLAALYDNTTQQAYQNFNYSLQQIPCNTTATAQYSLAKNCDDCAAAYKSWLCAVMIPRCADWSDVPTSPAGSFYNEHSSGEKSPVKAGDGRRKQDSSSHTLPRKSDGSTHLQPRNVAQQPIAQTPHISPVTDPTLLTWLGTNSSRNNATIAGRVQPGPYMEVLPCEELCYEIVRSCPASLGFGCPLPGRGLESSYGKRGVFKGVGVSCSEPGAVWRDNGAMRVKGRPSRWSGAVVVVLAAVLAWYAP